jgi:hypothetical protein
MRRSLKSPRNSNLSDLVYFSLITQLETSSVNSMKSSIVARELRKQPSNVVKEPKTKPFAR